jgi:hypothetical protein
MGHLSRIITNAVASTSGAAMDKAKEVGGSAYKVVKKDLQSIALKGKEAAESAHITFTEKVQETVESAFSTREKSVKKIMKKVIRQLEINNIFPTNRTITTMFNEKIREETLKHINLSIDKKILDKKANRDKIASSIAIYIKGSFEKREIHCEALSLIYLKSRKLRKDIKKIYELLLDSPKFKSGLKKATLALVDKSKKFCDNPDTEEYKLVFDLMQRSVMERRWDILCKKKWLNEKDTVELKRLAAIRAENKKKGPSRQKKVELERLAKIVAKKTRRDDANSNNLPKRSIKKKKTGAVKQAKASLNDATPFLTPPIVSGRVNSSIIGKKLSSSSCSTSSNPFPKANTIKRGGNKHKQICQESTRNSSDLSECQKTKLKKPDQPIIYKIAEEIKRGTAVKQAKVSLTTCDDVDSRKNSNNTRKRMKVDQIVVRNDAAPFVTSPIVSNRVNSSVIGEKLSSSSCSTSFRTFPKANAIKRGKNKHKQICRELTRNSNDFSERRLTEEKNSCFSSTFSSITNIFQKKENAMCRELGDKTANLLCAKSQKMLKNEQIMIAWICIHIALQICPDHRHAGEVKKRIDVCSREIENKNKPIKRYKLSKMRNNNKYCRESNKLCILAKVASEKDENSIYASYLCQAALVIHSEHPMALRHYNMLRENYLKKDSSLDKGDIFNRFFITVDEEVCNDIKNTAIQTRTINRTYSI